MHSRSRVNFLAALTLALSASTSANSEHDPDAPLFKVEAEAPGRAEELGAAQIDNEIRALEQKAFAEQADPVASQKAWRSVLLLNPRHTSALVNLGLRLLYDQPPEGTSDADRAAAMLEGLSFIDRAFDPATADPPVNRSTYEGFQMAREIGRSKATPYSYKVKFLQIAVDSPVPHDDCDLVILSSILPSYPRSVQHSDEVVERYYAMMDALLARPAIDLSSAVDPFEDCFISPMSATYHSGPGCQRMVFKLHALIKRTLPHLQYTAPHLRNVPPAPVKAKRRLKLGLISRSFGWPRRIENSCLTFLMPTMDRLSRDVFDVTFIFMQEVEAESRPGWYVTHNNVNDDPILHLPMDGDNRRSDAWLRNAREKIAQLELDMIMWFDVLSVRGFGYRVAMSRLAPVQAGTMGSVATSGISRETMDYYISWEAIELPLEEAQENYSEELVLVPADVMQVRACAHAAALPSVRTAQRRPPRYATLPAGPSLALRGSACRWVRQVYMYPKITSGALSATTGEPYLPLVNRMYFAPVVPRTDANWYICTQLPAKRHAHHDHFIARIQARDPKAEIVLIEEQFTINGQKVLAKRLADAGADMSRISFLPKLSHHQLLAMYSLADVVIDSYFHGAGATTAPEMFETGAPIVTLPSSHMSSRWVMGFYKIMGSENGWGLVARDADECVLGGALPSAWGSITPIGPACAVRTVSDLILRAASLRCVRAGLQVRRCRSACGNGAGGGQGCAPSKDQS